MMTGFPQLEPHVNNNRIYIMGLSVKLIMLHILLSLLLSYMWYTDSCLN